MSSGEIVLIIVCVLLLLVAALVYLKLKNETQKTKTLAEENLKNAQLINPNWEKEKQDLLNEKTKAEEKNKKLWHMSETVHKERKLVDEANEKLSVEKEKLEADKKKLDEKVKKLWAQSVSIHKEKERINELKIEIEHKHQEIIDSVRYARRIQRALISSEGFLNQNLKQHFVFFKPKDIVSGDFYWATNAVVEETEGNRDLFYYAVADSTGHGVPGAFMSLLNISFLNEAINEKKIAKTDEILNHVRNRLIQSLAMDGSEDGGKDGMDCSLMCFDFKNNILEYTCANNPLFIIRNNEPIELASDRMAVGKSPKEHIPFTSSRFELQKGDIVYAFTDGFPDQFGGVDVASRKEGGKKFKHKQLKEFLHSISSGPIEKQAEVLNARFRDWKGELEQIDDVLVVGIRI